MAEEKTTNELILDIELKDRRFRLAQSVFMVVITTSIVIVMIGLYLLVTRVETNTTRLQNYLKCSSLTPVADRTESFVDKCFETK